MPAFWEFKPVRRKITWHYQQSAGWLILFVLDKKFI